MNRTTSRAGASSAPTWVLALACVGSFMVALDGLVVMTALTSIRLDFAASASELEWAVNAFTLSFAVLLMTGAALGDRFGRRRIFVSGVALFTAASAACALAPDPGWLIGARAVQGAGAALVTPVALAMITAVFPAQERGRVLGVYSASIGLGVLLGPVVGGSITEGIAWQWIFWLNLPIGLALVVLTQLRVGESHGPRAGFDAAGVVLASLASFGAVWGLVRGNAAGWGSGEVVAALLGGGVFLASFIAWEAVAPSPMLPLRLFRSRRFAAGNAVSFFLFASNLSGTYVLAQLFQDGFGHGPLGAGLRLLPFTAALAVLAPAAGRLTDRVGERPLVVGGMLLQAVGAAWLALRTDLEVAYTELALAMVLIGVGTALTMPAAQRAVVGSVAPADIGRAGGIFSTLRWFGGTFGIAVAVAFFVARGGYASPGSFIDGFAPASSAATGFALVGAIAGCFIAVEPGTSDGSREATSRTARASART